MTEQLRERIAGGVILVAVALAMPLALTGHITGLVVACVASFAAWALVGWRA